jgi:hypothetical protein
MFFLSWGNVGEERRRGLGDSESRRYRLEMSVSWSWMEKVIWKAEDVGIIDWIRGGAMGILRRWRKVIPTGLGMI